MAVQNMISGLSPRLVLAICTVMNTTALHAPIIITVIEMHAPDPPSSLNSVLGTFEFL